MWLVKLETFILIITLKINTMQYVDINYGRLHDNRAEFTKYLKKSKTLVLLHCKEKNVAKIVLHQEKKQHTVSHIFLADGFIMGDNCRHAKNIDRDIVKRILTPKVDFGFQVWKDAKTHDGLRAVNMHSDVILLHVGDLEMYFDVCTGLDNSARFIHY